MLQCRCKTFVSWGDVLRSRVQCGESRVCLFQGEIGDRPCLLGMLLVMRSQELTHPSGSVSLPLILSSPYSLYPYFSLSSSSLLLHSLPSSCHQPSSDSFFPYYTLLSCLLILSIYKQKLSFWSSLVSSCMRACSCMHKCMLTHEHLCASRCLSPL